MAGASGVRVRLLPAGVELVLAHSERLLDALDDAALAASALPHACRAANCGACQLQVLAGAELLAPPDERERALLAELAAGPEDRLGCQLHAAVQGNGEVIVRSRP